MSNLNEEKIEGSRGQENGQQPAIETALERKPFFQAAMPVFACGAGLFSDGYINNVRTGEEAVMTAPCKVED